MRKEKSWGLSSLVEKVGASPFYLYDVDAMVERFNLLRSSVSLKNPTFHYAMKANSNSHVLKALKNAGAAVDVVSAGEMQRALECGFKPNQILFSGVGKTLDELTLALKRNIKQINVESFAELQRIQNLANKFSCKPSIGLRVNPNVNPKTHPYITTGFRENKFGISGSEFNAAVKLLAKSPNLRFSGLTMHIGSQITDLKPFKESIGKIKQAFLKLRHQGFGLQRLDVGGGLGIDYKKEVITDNNRIIKFGQIVSDSLADLDAEILFEPGRILTARFGYLFTEVQYVKRGFKNFIIVDTGMNHLIRPALYQAYHRIFPLQKRSGKITADVVGPLCESSDILGLKRTLSGIKQGDYLCIADTGAYGFSMASNYNLRGLPSEYVIFEGKLRLSH